MKVLPFRSVLESAWPRAVTCGVAFGPIASELYSKLTSRSMLGRFCAIEAIWSRSVVVSERVGRLRKVFTKAASSALRAASPGEAVSPRVIRAGFSALMISSGEGCSAAKPVPSPAGRAKPAATMMQAKLILSLLRCADMFLSLFLAPSAGWSRELE